MTTTKTPPKKPHGRWVVGPDGDTATWTTSGTLAAARVRGAARAAARGFLRSAPAGIALGVAGVVAAWAAIAAAMIGG